MSAAGGGAASSVRGRLAGQYFPMGRDEALKARVDGLVAAAMHRLSNVTNGFGECSGLAVTGESGAGKSTALNQIFRSNSAINTTYGRSGELCPLVSVNAPSPCSMIQLGRVLLRALGYPLVREPKKHIVWEMVRVQLEATQTVVLHIDEFHNITRVANVLEREELLMTLKSLMNDRTWPVFLILSGLPEVLTLLNRQTEVARRFHAIRFAPIDPVQDLGLIGEIIADYAGAAGVVLSKDLAGSGGGAEDHIGRAVGARLAHASNYALGILIEIVISAIEIAETQAKPLSRQHFRLAYLERTGCLDHMNPFVVDDWLNLPSIRLLAGVPSASVDEEDTNSGGGARRGTSRSRAKPRTF